VLEVALHTDGGTLVFNGYTHEQSLISFTRSDPIPKSITPDGFDFFSPRGCDKIYREGKKSPHEHSRY